MARRSSQTSRRSNSNTSGQRQKSGWRKFFSEKFREVKKQDSSLSTPEIMKKVAEMWRQADDDTKQQYQKNQVGQKQNQGGQGQKQNQGGQGQGQGQKQQQSSGSKKGSGQSSNKGNNNNNNNENDESDGQY